MGRVWRWLGWIAVALATARLGVAAPLYDMAPLLGQPHPLAATPRQAPAPAEAAAPEPMPPYSGVSRLYDMRTLVGRPHPLAAAGPARPPEALPRPRLTPPRPPPTMPPAAGVTRLYDMALFLG